MGKKLELKDCDLWIIDGKPDFDPQLTKMLIDLFGERWQTPDGDSWIGHVNLTVEMTDLSYQDNNGQRD